MVRTKGVMNQAGGHTSRTPTESEHLVIPMPTVRFRGDEYECEEGELLRDVLLSVDESPHNGRAKYLNCRGFGTCGTCAVEIAGPVSEPTKIEQQRLSVPPHAADTPLRLACQTRIEGDIDVIKYPGFWGQHVPDER